MPKTDFLKKYEVLFPSGDLIEICKPFFKSCGIDYFSYSRLYPDNTMAFVTTDWNWNNVFFRNKYPVSGIVIKSSGIYLQSDYFPDQHLRDFRAFGHCNGITLFNRTKNFLEFFIFATSLENYSVISFYVNHIDFVNQFLFYFKDKAEVFIDKFSKEKFIIPATNIGKSVKEVADILDVVPKTVDFHLTNAKNKSLCSSRHELIN